jgi:predicted ATPase with chaperone activity
VTSPSRISRARILEQLRRAARKGDRGALMLATDQMKTLAYSPRYWDKYLELLSNPLARLVDLMVIKQGDKIAHQKGWTRPKRERSSTKAKVKGAKAMERARRKRPAPPSMQGSLFPDLPS